MIMQCIYVIFYRTLLARSLVPQTVIMRMLYLLTTFQVTSVEHQGILQGPLKVETIVMLNRVDGHKISVRRIGYLRNCLVCSTHILCLAFAVEESIEYTCVYFYKECI